MFVAIIQVKPLAGCRIDPAEFLGAAVRCYIPATNEHAAMDMLLDSLKQHFLQLTEVELLVDDAKAEWENPESEEADELIREAEASRAVAYGEFSAWREEDED